MLVGLVNSGIMNISNTVGIIMGSNIGTTITAWLMSLIGVSSDNIFVKMLKPESFSPLLAFAGIVLIMLSKSSKRKDVGKCFIGFAILMYGMVLMSDSVEPLAQSENFSNIMMKFKNPLLGIIAGLVVTAVIQSSAASVGMLQALSMTGGITYAMAFPIIMGQNIGTCATAILSSIGVSKNAKRVAAIHLSFNLIGTAIFMLLYFIVQTFIDLPVMGKAINPAGIALCHSVFNIGTTILLLPFSNTLVKIATTAIKVEPQKQIAFIDERLFETPSVVVFECNRLSDEMAKLTGRAVNEAVSNLFSYDEKKGDDIETLEKDIDVYEDHLGTYLVKLSGTKLGSNERKAVSKVLHSIGDFERMSDHALNLVESAKEISEKKIEMSEQALKELTVLGGALSEIIDITISSYERMDQKLAIRIEPLEQMIDVLTAQIRQNHVDRLQNGECTIEKGFVLADILNNFERISDHCSNIAVAVIEAGQDEYDPHAYLQKVRAKDNSDFNSMFNEFKEKYQL